MAVSIKWHGALTLIIAAVSTCQSTACMDSVSTISIDSAFGAFASRRSLDLRAPRSISPTTSKQENQQVSTEQGGKVHAVHWRITRSLAFVDASAQASTNFKIEEIFDRIAVTGGVIIMGLGLTLPWDASIFHGCNSLFYCSLLLFPSTGAIASFGGFSGTHCIQNRKYFASPNKFAEVEKQFLPVSPNSHLAQLSRRGPVLGFRLKTARSKFLALCCPSYTIATGNLSLPLAVSPVEPMHKVMSHVQVKNWVTCFVQHPSLECKTEVLESEWLHILFVEKQVVT